MLSSISYDLKKNREKKERQRTDTDSEGKSGKQNLGKHMLIQHMKNMNSYQTKVGNFGTEKTSEPMIAQEYCFHHMVPIYRELLTHTECCGPARRICLWNCLTLEPFKILSHVFTLPLYVFGHL